jgi:hypothetical protein
MNRADRSKAANLETILARHDAAEARTLADLRRAGFHFRTIAAARQRLAVQHRLPGFTQEQIDTAVRALDKGKAA